MKTEYEGWPAIETAPKDGTRILLLFYSEVIEDHHVEIGRWWDPRSSRVWPFWRLDRDDDSALSAVEAKARPQPTAWAPIPYPKKVIGPVILPISDEPEVLPMTNAAPAHGIRFHNYEIEDDHVVVAGTRKAFLKWAQGNFRLDSPTDENIQETWAAIRDANAAGVTPWVFVGPYESDVHGECVLYVAMSRDDAKVQSESMAEDI